MKELIEGLRDITRLYALDKISKSEYVETITKTVKRYNHAQLIDIIKYLLLDGHVLFNFDDIIAKLNKKEKRGKK